MKVTEVFNKNLRAYNTDGVRMIVNYGGSSSSKTISILQILLLVAMKHPNKRIVVISETVPKLKRTVIKDFQKIVIPQDDLEKIMAKCYNKSEMIYSFPNGSEIMFLSADTESKIIGLRSDILYFDEVNHIPKDVYNQLTIRCKEKVFCSYNPSSKFYIMEEFSREDVVVIHSTYKDNQYVDKNIIKELIEKGKKNKNFRRVYLEGKLGVLEGLIFEEDINYTIVDKKLHEFILDNNKDLLNTPYKVTKTMYGMDFGFQDPTSLVRVSLIGDKKLYVEQLMYKSKHTPDTMLSALNKLNINRGKIIADSARPELIEYLFKNRINIHSVKKTKIIDGINNLLDYHIFIHEEDVETIEELRNYAWKKDKSGDSLEEPIDGFNHIIDAIRYSVTDINRTGKMSVTMI